MEDNNCPKCFASRIPQSRFCPNCGNDFAPAISFSYPPKTINIVLLTVCGTLVLVAVGLFCFWLGMNLNKTNDVVIQQNQNIANSQTVLTSNANQVNTSVLVNLNKNTATPKPRLTLANSDANQSEPQIKRQSKDIKNYDWTYITVTSDTSDGYYYFYNEHSVKKQGLDNVEVWCREYPFYPSIYAKKNSLNQAVDYRMSRISINCKTEMFQVEEESFFDLKGSQIPTKLVFYRWQGIAPGTMTEALKETVCK